MSFVPFQSQRSTQLRTFHGLATERLGYSRVEELRKSESLRVQFDFKFTERESWGITRLHFAQFIPQIRFIPEGISISFPYGWSRQVSCMDDIRQILVYVFFLACNFQQDKLYLSLLSQIYGG